MRRTLLWAMVGVVALADAAAAQQYSLEPWGVEQGLPNNALTSIIQTRDGYLWIATWAGTVRFDGVRFSLVAEELPSDRALALLEDRDGAVWIGLSGGGLSRWRQGHLDTFTPAQGFGGQDTRALAADGEGRVWAATENGLSALADGRVTTLRVADGLSDNNVTAVAAARDGNVWVATVKGICKTRALKVDCAMPVPAFTGAPQRVIEDRGGHLWVGTTAGVFGGDASCDRGVCFPGRGVAALLQARDGAMWVGFTDGGIGIIRGGQMAQEYRRADGLPAGPAVSIYEDPEGSVWVATYNGGLTRFRPQRVTVFSTAQGLPAKVAGAVVQDSGGAIWAGTQCGPVAEFRNGRFVPRFEEYTRDACAWTLLTPRDGTLWIGTRGQGLLRWDGRRMERFDQRRGLSDQRVSALFEDRDGTVWIGTEFGGVHRYHDGRLSRAYGVADGIAAGYVSTFAQDRDGRVWIGSVANGLSVYEHDRFRTLTGSEAPPSKNISALLVDSRGDLWLGTVAEGLYRRRDGRYEPFGIAQGLGDRLVAIIVEDRAANLWVATARGIVRVERERIEAVADGRAASLEPIILDRTDGLLNPEGSGGGQDPSGLRDRDGRVWLSTIDGVVRIDPATFRTNTVVPRVRIEAITLDGRPATLRPDGIEVPAGTAAIELEYTAFSFLAPQKLRFRYRLGGLETDFRHVGARRSASYSLLPPGTYTFEVHAANNDGLWSTTPARIPLIVAPFWWQRTNVRLGGLVLLLLTSGGAVRYVTLRRARARVRELEREQALTRERARIARDLHDDLGARLSHIALIADRALSTDSRDRLAIAARDAVEAMDELVWTVSARHDTVESLGNYIARFAEEHVGLAGLRLRMQIQPDLQGFALGAEMRRDLFLAFKEAVNNAVKHAHASEIHVGLKVRGGILELEVADNGRGLPAGGGDKTGHGLSNFSERMHAAGGSVTVDSAPGKGVRLVFSLPLSVDAALPAEGGA